MQRFARKPRADCGLGREGEDEAGNVALAGLLEDGEPDLFAQLYEGLAAEIEDGQE